MAKRSTLSRVAPVARCSSTSASTRSSTLTVAGFTTSAAALVVVLGAAGAFGSGVNAASGRAVMGWFASTERGLALGIRQTAVPVGGALSAVVLPSLVHREDAGPAFFFLAGGCAVAGAIGALFLRERDSEVSGDSSPRLLQDARLWRLGIGGTLLVFAQISLISFIPLFLHRHRGLSLAAAGAVLALTQVLGGAARIGAGWISDHVQARVRLIRSIGLALVAALVCASVLVDSPLALLLPALVAAGTLGLSWNGLSFTATAELAGRGRSGAAIGLQQTLLSTGAAIAPIAFAAVVGAASWRAAFAVAALGPALAFAVLRPLSESKRARRRPTRPR